MLNVLKINGIIDDTSASSYVLNKHTNEILTDNSCENKLRRLIICNKIFAYECEINGGTFRQNMSNLSLVSLVTNINKIKYLIKFFKQIRIHYYMQNKLVK